MIGMHGRKPLSGTELCSATAKFGTISPGMSPINSQEYYKIFSTASQVFFKGLPQTFGGIRRETPEIIPEGIPG